jgi:hypothetical protein
MRAYTVHAPPDEPDAAEKFVFVKDGFSWPALFVPVLWILWHRLWLTLLGYVVYVLALAWMAQLAGEENATIVGLLGTVLFAMEANNLRRWTLQRRGWREIGAARGADLGEAEARFFAGWGRAAEERRRGAALPVYAAARTRAGDGEEPILGLFPEPER